MELYQQRVVEERTELEDKRDRLQDFINSERFNSLPDAEQGRMVCQYHIMSSYALVLEQRIEAF